MSMPVASAISSASAVDIAPVPTLTVEEIAHGLKGLTMNELVRVGKAVALESEKRFKVYEKEASKASRGKKPKRVGSMPKGVLPPQFRKPNAWKMFVFADAKENGWPAFTVHIKRKNKETGEVEPEETEYSASSKAEDGAFVFDTGRAFNEKDAMSLSKIYWDNKNSQGLRKDLWVRFEAQYVDDAADSSASRSSSAASAVSMASPVLAPVAVATASSAATSEPPVLVKRVKKTAVPSL